MNGGGNHSIYPELMRSSVGRVREHGALGQDLNTLFAALQQFQRDLREHGDVADILAVTQQYVAGLNLFEATGFFLANPVSFDFEVASCEPPAQQARLERLVALEIESGKFARALRNATPVFTTMVEGQGQARVVLHSLGTGSQVVGMFCGALRQERVASQEITFNLLSSMLGTCAYALGSARTAADLKNKALAANESLQRTLQENAVLARIPAESPWPVIRLSREGCVLYVNEPGAALIQKSGLGHGDILDGDWLKVLDTVFSSGEKHEFELSASGRTYAFVAVAVPEAGYANFYATDITARKKAEEELRHANEAAQAASRAKSEFLANMSHEIRTPMNAVLGFADLLDRHLTEPRQRDSLAAIASSGRTLLMLINDILDLSKIEAGKLELQYEPVALGQVIREVQQIFSQKATERGVALQVDVQAGMPATLVLDEVRLRQILFNVVGNALKFTESGHVRILASARALAEDPTRVVLTLGVEDTGIGIPLDQQSRIFESFSQVSGQSTKRYGGTGLGLAITRRLTEMMHGRVSLESAPGKGSRFLFEFADVEVGPASALSANSAAGDTDFNQFAHAVVLVADDVELNRRLLRGYFEGSRLRMLSAANGVEVLEMAKRRPPDLVLMDIRMPGIDGIEASAKIREDPVLRGIPIIALTASSCREDEVRIRALCDGFLRKPVGRAELVAEFKRFLKTAPQAASPAVGGAGCNTTTFVARLLPPSILDRWPEMLAELRREQRESVPGLLQTLSSKGLRQLASRLAAAGEAFQATPLRRFARRLDQAASSFDLEALPEILRSFTSVIEELETIHKTERSPAQAA